jgi:hypothetical protein
MKPGPMNLVYLTTFRRILWKKPGRARGARPGWIPSMHFIDCAHFDEGTVSSDDVECGVASGAVVQTTAMGCSGALRPSSPSSMPCALAD